MPDGGDKIDFGVTERAAAKLRGLLANEESPNAKFRVAVSGGGCSGFQYGFSFDETVNADDCVFKTFDVTIVVDEISLDLLRGAVVDWKEDLSAAMFVVENPNAASSCGCGSSFSI